MKTRSPTLPPLTAPKGGRAEANSLWHARHQLNKGRMRQEKPERGASL
jgi:hypothetical protein